MPGLLVGPDGWARAVEPDVGVAQVVVERRACVSLVEERPVGLYRLLVPPLGVGLVGRLKLAAETVRLRRGGSCDEAERTDDQDKSGCEQRPE